MVQGKRSITGTVIPSLEYAGGLMELLLLMLLLLLLLLMLLVLECYGLCLL
jgi:hypothetical protein